MLYHDLIFFLTIHNTIFNMILKYVLTLKRETVVNTVNQCARTIYYVYTDTRVTNLASTSKRIQSDIQAEYNTLLYQGSGIKSNY